MHRFFASYVVWWLFVASALLAFSVRSEAASIQLVAPDTPFSTAVLSALQKRLGNGHSVRYEPLDEFTGGVEQDSAPNVDVTIALGNQAYNRVRESGRKAVVAAYVSYSSLKSPVPAGHRVLYAEVDPALQLRLLQQLFPKRKKIGVLVSGNSDWVQDYLREVDKQNSTLKLVFRQLNNADQMAEALPGFFASIDVLLAVPDRELYNARTARLVLLTGYRQGKPVIGPSQAFVKAGSVASLYFQQEDMLDELIKRVDVLLANPESRGRAEFSDAWSLVFNQHVLHSYDKRVLDEETVKSKIRQGGGP